MARMHPKMNRPPRTNNPTPIQVSMLMVLLFIPFSTLISVKTVRKVSSKEQVTGLHFQRSF
jgi:hypothetical protein